VILTTSDEARDRERAAHSGAVGYLIKPLFQETVLEMLHSVGLDELLTV
jgi:CheY-like chemotaxis protein